MNEPFARRACALGLTVLPLTAPGCAQQSLSVELTATPAPTATADRHCGGGLL